MCGPWPRGERRRPQEQLRARGARVEPRRAGRERLAGTKFSFFDIDQDFLYCIPDLRVVSTNGDLQLCQTFWVGAGPCLSPR